MNHIISIQNEDYILIKDYKDQEAYRRSLNRLAMKTYGFDFEDWYKAGYWKDKYIPFSLIHQGEVVANISVSKMDFLINGEIVPCLQIGTVMTEEEYRHRGLSRALMELVLKEFEGSYQLIYLYANDSVLEFYPKFGFTKAEEYVHTRKFIKSGKQYAYRKLDMKLPEDRELLVRLVTKTLPVAKISMVGNPGLDLFYLTKFMSEDIYYFKDLDLAAVAEFEDGNLLLMDAFCPKEFHLEEVIFSLMDREQMKVTLGFTPTIMAEYDCEILKEEGSTFFVRGKYIMDHGRFPILSHA
jgi:ribosomal protein S18 acetylase RimI-like enzyme